MNSTPPKILYIVVCTIGVLAFICVSSLCLSLFYHVYADAAIMTAIITISGGLIGSLGTLLSSTRTASTQQDTTTTVTSTSTPAATAQPLGADPVTVKIDQPINEPVPVTETTESKP